MDVAVANRTAVHRQKTCRRNSATSVTRDSNFRSVQTEEDHIQTASDSVSFIGVSRGAIGLCFTLIVPSSSIVSFTRETISASGQSSAADSIWPGFCRPLSPPGPVPFFLCVSGFHEGHVPLFFFVLQPVSGSALPLSSGVFCEAVLVVLLRAEPRPFHVNIFLR